jgi:hypothetical protein
VVSARFLVALPVVLDLVRLQLEMPVLRSPPRRRHLVIATDAPGSAERNYARSVWALVLASGALAIA